MASQAALHAPAAAIKDITQLLGSTWRITIQNDERVFVGKFLVLDRRKNVILDDATEERAGKKRNVGLIMLPGKHILTAEVDRDTLPV